MLYFTKMSCVGKNATDHKRTETRGAVRQAVVM